MSKGSDRITLRVPAEMLSAMDAHISESLHTRHGEPWTRTSYVLAAIAEKLAHRERSRSKGRKRKTKNAQ